MFKRSAKHAFTITVSTCLCFIWLVPMSFADDVHTEDSKDVIIKYKNTAGKNEVIENAVEVKNEFNSIHSINAVLPESDIARLKEDSNIASIRTNQKLHVLGNPGPMQWSLNAIHAADAWKDGYTGKKVKVAVVDTGISSHPELKIAGAVSFTDDLASTPDRDESSLADYDGHGTHVAGIIASQLGIATVGMPGATRIDVAGVSPDVSLYEVKVTNGKGAEGTVAQLIQGIEWCIAHRMDIVNISLGVDGDDPALKAAVDRAYQSGVLVVSAAGNDKNGNPVEYPAKYEGAIAVSSVDPDLQLSSFSSTGDEVEFSAPGASIISTYRNRQYAEMEGTSMASPHVAGFLALLKEKYPAYNASELRKELRSYTRDLGAIGRDLEYGYGFIDYAAYHPFVNEQLPVQGLATGEKTATSLSFSWKNPASLAGIHIYQNGSLIADIKKSTETQYTLKHLQPDTDYTIEVRAVDEAGIESVPQMLKMSTLPQQIAGPASSFKDVDSANAAAVAYLSSKGIVGLTQDLFGTVSPIKRVDAAVMFAKALDLPFTKTLSFGFTDVPSRAVHEVDAIKVAGITNGKTATQFGSESLIARGELAIWTMNAFKLKSSGETKLAGVPARYQQAVGALAGAGIISDGNRYGTNIHATRGDVAQYIYKAALSKQLAVNK
ncbi:S8 family serine peptidase [Bacillus testis]|uniref:S8 family serine peptidase n=1 Tax=Bacillus testis TaxID=1622072 RepID=UPI00067EB243|nr:S8 family serine peptidase [Bacillus testis]